MQLHGELLSYLKILKKVHFEDLLQAFQWPI